MLYTLHIKAFSEAEFYFMQLYHTIGFEVIRVDLDMVHDGVICNDYIIDEKTYNEIKSYLIENRKDQG